MLEIDIGTVIFSIVTFALLALLLRLFLYKPVLAMLDILQVSGAEPGTLHELFYLISANHYSNRSLLAFCCYN